MNLQHKLAISCLTFFLSVPGLAVERRLDKTARRCLAERLAARPQAEIPLGPRDAFAVMDPHTGRILWLRHPRVLAQRAYEPGSIFKVITAYVALSEGKVDPGEAYRCQGWKRLVGDKSAQVRCWLKPGHGPVNLAKALALSCNLYFANLGTRVGAGPILRGARSFGLGKSTGSDLPGEIHGSLPPFPVMEQAARLAVGQGNKVDVTSLQVLSLVGAVANGGALLSPTQADPGGGRTGERGALPDAGALRFLRDAMEEASTFGTGHAQRLRKLHLAGKTGTATWKKGWKTHAWYMGFAPMREPLVALVVFVFDGQGSKEAASVARRVMETVYFEMKGCGVEVRK